MFKSNDGQFGLGWAAKTWIIGVVAILAIAGVGSKLYKAKSGGETALVASNRVPEPVVKAAGFPVYYAADLPGGYNFSSAKAQNGIVNLIYGLGDSKQLIITEQPKPVNIEQVTKLKDVTTSIGPAYIANLNGRQVGFVQTDQTLIILTSDSDVSGSDMERLMTGLRLVN